MIPGSQAAARGAAIDAAAPMADGGWRVAEGAWRCVDDVLSSSPKPAQVADGMRGIESQHTYQKIQCCNISWRKLQCCKTFISLLGYGFYLMLILALSRSCMTCLLSLSMSIVLFLLYFLHHLCKFPFMDTQSSMELKPDLFQKL